MKELNEKKIRVVTDTQVNTPESLLTIKPGDEAVISCVEFSPYSTVKSAVTRLNQKAGWKEFKATTPDNGATIVVKRNRKRI